MIPRRLLIHSAILLLFLVLWTWKLLEPHPVPEEISEGLAKAGLSYIAAKTLHAAGYAFLAILAVTLPAPRRWRGFLVGLLVWHGIATEIGQTFIPNRTGRVRDVFIDWLGIGLGLLAVLLWKRRRPPGPGPGRGDTAVIPRSVC